MTASANMEKLPFTLAHPAAVLPLRKKLVFSALVIGSMAPDFRYFFFVSPRGHFSHSKEGILLFCLPVGLLVLWLFERIVKLPAISLAPDRHRQRWIRFATPFCWTPLSRFALIVASLLLGTLTHLVWDAFTHESGAAVRNMPDLRDAEPLLEFGSHRPLYNVLQHGSSLVGMGILVVAYWIWFRKTAPQPVKAGFEMSSGARRWILWTIFLLALLASVSYAYIRSNHAGYWPTFAALEIITFMSLICVEVVIYSLWWQWRHRRASTWQAAELLPKKSP